MATRIALWWYHLASGLQRSLVYIWYVAKGNGRYDCNIKPICRRIQYHRSTPNLLSSWPSLYWFGCVKPSLMNFCVTDGETVVVTRYISSKTDEAASLVRSFFFVQFHFYRLILSESGFPLEPNLANMQKVVITRWAKRISGKILSWWAIPLSSWFYIFDLILIFIQIASEPLTFERGISFVRPLRRQDINDSLSRLDGDQDQSYGCYHTQDEPPPDTH